MVWNPSDGFFNTLFPRTRACIPEPATKNSTHRNSVAGIDRLTQGKDSAAYACQAAGQTACGQAGQACGRVRRAQRESVGHRIHVSFNAYRRLCLGDWRSDYRPNLPHCPLGSFEKETFKSPRAAWRDYCEASAYRTILSESLGKRSVAIACYLYARLCI